MKLEHISESTGEVIKTDFWAYPQNFLFSQLSAAREFAFVTNF